MLVAVAVTFIFGIFLGYVLFSDQLVERGHYVIGDGDKPSGWMHGGSLFLPESGRNANNDAPPAYPEDGSERATIL